MIAVAPILFPISRNSWFEPIESRLNREQSIGKRIGRLGIITWRTV